MLSRIPPQRKSATLVAAALAIGALIGALIIALSQGGRANRVVVKHVVAPTPALKTRTADKPARTTKTADKSPARPQPTRAPALSSAGSALSADATVSFGALDDTLGGQVGLAVAPTGPGPIRTLGSLQAGHAWSTMKVPVLAALLHYYERSGGVLSAQGHADATLAVEQSDNAAAENLFAALEQIHGGLVPASAAVQQTLDNAGDQTTTINTVPNNQGFTTWGQSIWSTTGEVLFYRALADGCLLGPHDTAFVMRLMSSVTPSQRWGAGAAGYPSGLPLAFKAGWGPDNGGGYLVRQTAIVGSGSRGYVVSMIARPADGSFTHGVSMITALATWAQQHVRLADGPPPACASLS